MADDLIKYYKEYYDKLKSNAYMMEKWKDSSRVRFFKEYLSRNTPTNGSILDIGCGDMHMSYELPQFTWLGLDINTDKAKGNAIAHDLMTSPYPVLPNSMDSIMCSEVLEHLWDLRIVHKEAFRMLKPGGFYIVSTPNFDWIDHHLSQFNALLFDDRHPHLFEHIRQYNFSVHQRYLEQAGFKIEAFVGADAQYTKFFQPMRAVLSNYLNKQHNLNVTQGEVDQLIGMGFPLHDHTIIVTARKPYA